MKRSPLSLLVLPQAVVPLCPQCHARFDGQAQPPLDLLPYLNLDEQLCAVRQAGGIVSALERTTSERYVPVREVA